MLTDNFYILLLAALLIGIGQGGVGTLTAALVADYFAGEECGAILGWQSAFVTGGGMLVLFIAGLLAGISWNYSYLVFLILIPIIILTVTWLPKANASSSQGSGLIASEKGNLNKKVYFYCLVSFTNSFCLYIFIANVSLFVSSHGLGNATTSGLANTIMSAMGCLSGITTDEDCGNIKSIFC